MTYNTYWECARRTGWGWIFLPFFVVFGIIIPMVFLIEPIIFVSLVFLMIPSYFWFIPYFIKGLYLENSQVLKAGDSAEN